MELPRMQRMASFREERTEEEIIAKFAHKLNFHISHPQVFFSAKEALDYVEELYEASCEQLRQRYSSFVSGEKQAYTLSTVRPDLKSSPANQTGTYPFIGMRVDAADIEKHKNEYAAYALFRAAGYYGATITAPKLFRPYLLEQLSLLIERYEVPIVVGLSGVRVPLPYVSNYQPSAVSNRPMWELHASFAMPDLGRIDDSLPNGTASTNMAGVSPGLMPLSLFTAERTDFSLQRLAHYTGTACQHFQGFILLTNYQMYVDQFVAWGTQQVLARHAQEGDGQRGVASGPQEHQRPHQYAQQPGEGRGTGRAAASGGGAGGGGSPGKESASGQTGGEEGWSTSFLKLMGPRDTVLADSETGTSVSMDSIPSLPQMPAYHLVRPDGLGITMINIGVGPSNAKTITDHLAVLRPHLFLMLGHCAGLRMSQRLGDYVLAHAYVREDHVLDQDLPLWVPLPPIAEVQVALEAAVAKVLEAEGAEVKSYVRTGTLVTTDDRDWELRANELKGRFKQSRAIGVDMESATIAANGFRFRVPYGTLLCISDKPIHGELKLAGMANTFYKQRVGQHLQIGLEAVHILCTQGVERLQSRKMRGFDEPPFR